MIVKLLGDTIKQMTATCGEVDMVLGTADYPHLNVALCPNKKPMIGHFHPGFDEAYFVLDGWVEVKTYDPVTDKFEETRLGPDELILFHAGTHHKVTAASEENRLCVRMIPGFNGETPSDKL